MPEFGTIMRMGIRSKNSRLCIHERVDIKPGMSITMIFSCYCSVVDRPGIDSWDRLCDGFKLASRNLDNSRGNHPPRVWALVCAADALAPMH